MRTSSDPANVTQVAPATRMETGNCEVGHSYQGKDWEVSTWARKHAIECSTVRHTNHHGDLLGWTPMPLPGAEARFYPHRQATR